MKIQVGDIFEFQVNENSKSYGQIVDVPNKDSLVIIIFEGQYRYRPDLVELLKDNVLFFGISLDAKFYHKHWIIIGNNTSNISDIKFPYYKIGVDTVYIENFEGNRLRKASIAEELALQYRTVIAPVRFELALKAYYKQIEWKDKYNHMLYSEMVKGIQLVEGKTA